LFLKEVVVVLSPRVPRDLAGCDSNFDSRTFGYCAEWLVIVCEYPQVTSQLFELLSAIPTELPPAIPTELPPANFYVPQRSIQDSLATP